MKEQTRRWLDAAKILMEEPDRKILCSECEIGYLIVKDVPIIDREKMIDRYLMCNHCGKWNEMTMELPG